MAKPLAAILKSYSDVIAGKLPASEVNKLTLGKEPGVDYDPKMPDEREFVASHSIEKHPDRAGNGPDVYNGAKVKQSVDARHGNIPNPKSKNQYKQANEEVDLDEKKDESEYGYEGDMAITQLKTICRNSENIMKMLKPKTDLPEWVQSKITKAEDYISTANEYLSSEMTEEVEKLDELKGHGNKRLLRSVEKRATNRLIKATDPMWTSKSGMSDKDRETADRNKKVANMARDRLGEEAEELDEGGSQYRSAAGSGKNTNPNLSRLARKLAFEKPKSFRPPGEKSKAENREILDSEIAKFMKKGGKIRKEEAEELDEAKCNMSEANKMCEVHGMKACPKEGDESASDMEPRRTGEKDKPGVKKLLTDKKQIEEKLTKGMSAGDVIKDFEKSDDPRFKGDSKEKRKSRALATWYKMHPEKSKKKMKEESSPADTTITFPSGNSREGFKL